MVGTSNGNCPKMTKYDLHIVKTEKLKKYFTSQKMVLILHIHELYSKSLHCLQIYMVINYNPNNLLTKQTKLAYVNIVHE